MQRLRALAGIVLLFLVLAVWLTPRDLRGQDQEAAANPAAVPQATEGSRDHFVGWFALSKPTPTGSQAYQAIPGREALIPVFKRNGGFWTACWGVEVPLKDCLEGLALDMRPSTMEGTKIGFDEASKEYYIILEDTYFRDVLADGSYVSGVKQPLTKVEPPSGLLDTAADPPRTNDDFVGWYQPVWMPFFRYEIRKENDKFFAVGQVMTDPLGQLGEANAWSQHEEQKELTPLPDRLGFLMGSDDVESVITYNAGLKRFEIVVKDESTKRYREPSVLRIPLARVPAPPSAEQDAVPPLSPAKLIGIPSTRG